MNKEKYLKAGLIVQIGLAIFAFASIVLALFEPTLEPITERLIGISLLVMAINNQLLRKKILISLLLVGLGLVFLIGLI